MQTTHLGHPTQAYFPVSLQPVFVRKNEDALNQTPDYHAVVRDDTGAVLGIHRGSYRLVPNQAVYEPFEEAIERSGLDCSGITVREGLAYQGRLVLREYFFPNLITEPQVGDVVEFSLKTMNSYDATNAFRVQMAGRRRLCLNGLIGPEQSATVYCRHTTGFSVERVLAGIRKAFERYLALDAEWKRWTRRSVTEHDVESVFESMPGHNPKRLERLRTYWALESQSAGRTVWGLYNALTHFSSHDPVRAASLANRSAIVVEREALVSRTLNLEPFRRLAS
jgi:hypothetical protein